MSQANILMVKSPQSSYLASELCEILNSSSCLNLSHEPEKVKLFSTNLGGDSLTELIRDLTPNLFLIVICSSFLEQVNSLLHQLKTEAAGTPVIVVMEEGQPAQMVELLKYGVGDFLTPPLKAVDILPHVWRLTEGAMSIKAFTEAPQSRPEFKQLIGRSPIFIAEVNKIPLVAKCDASVLITGETGTGKELFARAIHYFSPRARKPFIPINCGAIPTDLIENELFGHERGAYTGAATSKSGLIKEAHGGTFFLDEIDCLSSQSQVKLLRFLQEKEYRPVGSTKIHRADTRIIAASNVGFPEAVRSGKLRQDLYYRLNVVPFALPPLRERREDIPLLARHFLSKYSTEFGKQARDFSVEAMQKLIRYNWLGNVRELEHIVERAVILSEQSLIRETEIILSQVEPTHVRHETFQEAKTNLITQFERNYIQDLLIATEGNVSKAARAAHKNRRAFWQLISKHHIDVQQFRVAFK